MVLEEKYIGLALAIGSNSAIGVSFIITKKGLLQADEHHGFRESRFSYLRSPTWWVGITTLAIEEVGNFTAYAFAPAILITPLGALSVLVSAMLGPYFLQETLGALGRLGIAVSILGAILVVLHAPPNEDIQTIDQIWHHMMQPGSLLYFSAVAIFVLVMIYKVAPISGQKNPLVYLSICSTVGSVSIIAIKAFGIALKLTFAGDNQFSHPSTYGFFMLMSLCVLTQMNYFNKALTLFPSNIVNPLYYVAFTTATVCSSFIVFQGFGSSGIVNTLSLICGLLLIFAGVYLLNMTRHESSTHRGTQSR